MSQKHQLPAHLATHLWTIAADRVHDYYIGMRWACMLNTNFGLQFREASVFATCTQDQEWQDTPLRLTCRSDSCKPTCCMRSPSGCKENIVPLTSHTMPFTLDQDIIGYARRVTGEFPLLTCELRCCQGSVATSYRAQFRRNASLNAYHSRLNLLHQSPRTSLWKACTPSSHVCFM